MEKVCMPNHILIVDDDEFNIYTLQKLLGMIGVIVDEKDHALNGKDAIEMMTSK